jgi:hypothetical protein
VAGAPVAAQQGVDGREHLGDLVVARRRQRRLRHPRSRAAIAQRLQARQLGPARPARVACVHRQLPSIDRVRRDADPLGEGGTAERTAQRTNRLRRHG